MKCSTILKSNQLTTAEMKLTLTGLFLFVLYGLTTGIISVQIYVTTPMNCTNAQEYCQLFYKDLSKISSNEELQMLKVAAGGKYNQSWISSRYSCHSLKSEVSSTFVVKNEISSLCFDWVGAFFSNTVPCSKEFPFFCYENLILVQENKTWEDALQYCRSHYTDLAYFGSERRLNQITNETKNTQTDCVWTGLRFVAGNWHWLMEMMETENNILPLCPTEPYRCGARNTKTEQWENRDCDEKLNFLCVER